MIAVMIGSLRSASHNRRLADELLAHIDEPVLEIDLSAIPPYNEDLEDHLPPAVEHLRAQIEGTRAMIVVSPEYNGSIPGHLKNALDWLSRPFPDNALKGKPVAIFGASNSLFGSVWAQAELRKSLGIIGAKPVGDGEIPVSYVQNLDPILAGDLKEQILERLSLLDTQVEVEV